MKRFTEWLDDLTESVTFQISDIQSDQKNEDLHSLSWKLASRVRKMFPEEFESIKLDFYDLITPDGDYYGPNRTEEINYYAGFFPEESRKKILDAILYLLSEFNIKLNGSVRKDDSRVYKKTVYRIPVMHVPNKNPAPELNIANGNARELLNMLNIHGDLCGNISVQELNMKLSTITDFHKNMTTRAPEIKSNFVSHGLSVNQLERYIDTLEKMIQWALKNNYDTISYC
jgi:hypothetical protein